MFSIALVGYTNAGKSTLFNKLVSENVLSKNMLFSTLDPTIRELILPSGIKIVVSDTVGFISDLPTELITSFKATLEEIKTADLILHIRDLTSPVLNDEKETVYKILSELKFSDEDIEGKVIEVFNKNDQLKIDELDIKLNLDNQIQISAINGNGIKNLLDIIERKLCKKYIETYIILPINSGKITNWLYENSIILQNKISKNGKIKLTIKISEINFNKFKIKWPNLYI